MQNFTDWTGKTPEELLTEVEDEIKSDKLMRQRRIKAYLIGFQKHLQDQKLNHIKQQEPNFFYFTFCDVLTNYL